MRVNSFFAGFIVSLWFLTVGCEKPPELPVEPVITFDNIRFIPGDLATIQDSLIVTIRFEDGDGDLGLSSADTLFPYNKFFILLDADGSFITFSESNGKPPYSEQDWLIALINQGDTVPDTIQIRSNPNFFNFFVEFQVQSENGEFEKLDVTKLLGFSFNGRFPILNEGLQEKALEGTLQYRMSSFFRVNPTFRNNTLRLRVQIQDRSFHKSNFVLTNEFRMRDS